MNEVDAVKPGAQIRTAADSSGPKELAEAFGVLSKASRPADLEVK